MRTTQKMMLDGETLILFLQKNFWKKKYDVVILFIPEADDKRVVDILLSVGCSMGENLFTTPRFLVGKQGILEIVLWKDLSLD